MRVRLFRLFLLIPCWESQRLIPKRSAGPRATKIGVVSLKALDHHRPNREGQQKRSQRRARDRADDASRLIPTRARQDACKPETKGAPRRSKDTPGKGSCDRERYPWFVAHFGLKVGIVGIVGFEQRIHDLVEGVPELADIMEPLLAARRVLREKFDDIILDV